MAAVTLRIMGIGNSSGAQAITGNIFTGGERVLFPLAGSLTSAPTLAATYLVAAIPMVIRTSKYRIFRFIGTLAAFYVLVQGDRRSALISMVVLLMLPALAPRRFRQFAPFFIGFLLSLPFVLKITGNLTDKFDIGILQRTGETNSESLNTRLQIWSKVLEFYQDRVDWLHQLFGYGTSGQAVSGASLTYRKFFLDARDQNVQSPHNSVIQTLFDGGWVAATGFAITVVCLARIISHRYSAFDLAGLAMLTSLTIVGTTEAVLAPGYPQPVWWTVMALGIIGFSKANGQTNRPQSAVRRTRGP